MGGIGSQLGHLFVQSLPTVIFVFLLLVILTKIFFQPLIRVMKKREEQTSGALVKAKEQTEAAEARTREYELAFQSARQEVYRQREIDRQEANKERETTLQKAREQSEATVHTAQLELEAQLAAAKKELAPASQSLAGEIVEVVLDNRPSSFRPGGTRP